VGGKPLMVRSAPIVKKPREVAGGAHDPRVDAEEEMIKKFFTA
jgi:hypothetical protein